MTLTTPTALRPRVISRRPQAVAQQVLTIVAAALILAGVAAWLIIKLIDQPALFLSSAMAGLQNGVLYALIALGYTLRAVKHRIDTGRLHPPSGPALTTFASGTRSSTPRMRMSYATVCRLSFGW